MATSYSSNEELFEKIKLAQELLSRCNKIPDVPGKKKLLKKINAEFSFLKKLVDSKKFQPDHLKSSNLSHLSSVIKCHSEVEGSVRLFEPFHFHDLHARDNSKRRLVIDVVCDYGNTWIKVIARNPLALVHISNGAGKYGQKTISQQIQDMIECAKQNRHLYKPPKVKIWFSGIYTKELEDILENLPVEVTFCNEDERPSSKIESLTESKLHGSSKENQFSCQSSHNDECLKNRSHSDCEMPLCSISKDTLLNLDISSMIAYVSNLTNGHAHAKLEDKILSEQAVRELTSSVQDVLKKLFLECKLMCCQTAYSDFQTIVSVVGGASEKERAKILLEKVQVVPDKVSERTLQLKQSSKIKKRSKIVFGTGDSYQAITVTANYGFLRAAQGQGVRFVAVFHESRALSEMKELNE